ncbi:MAG: hypothetical protein GXO45_01695, partial [Aquificae bacterium]|nr:hypothetical protein [Aquificota bacterium]
MEKTEKDNRANTPQYVCEEDEIDLYELWLTLKRWKWIPITTTLLTVLLAVVYAFFIAKPVYRTEAKILPLESGSGGLSSYKAIAGMLGISVGGGGKTDKLIAVLESDTLKLRVIRKMNLLPILFEEKWDKENNRWILEEGEEPPDERDGLEKLKKLISVSRNKKVSVINITVDYPEKPEVAYQIAKNFLEEAQKIINEKSFTLAKRYRKYLEEQLILVKKKIDLLEKLYMDYVKGKIKSIPYIFDIDGSLLGKGG